MRKLIPLSVALALVLLAVPAAQAQGKKGRGGRGGFMSSVALLQQKSVQEELKLSEDQVAKVKELGEKQRGGFKDFKDLSDEEKKQKIAERNAANDKAIGEVLKTDQVKRLKEISLQVRGVRAFSDAKVAEALKLTDDQKEKLKTISDESRKEMFSLFKEEGGREKIAALRKTTNEKAINVLTPEQKATWKDLTGAPFTGEIVQPKRGGRRPNAQARTAPAQYLTAARMDRRTLVAR